MNSNPESHYTYHKVTRWGANHKINRQKSIFSYLIPPLPEKATILEVGSGRGEFADEVTNRGFQYIGIEPSLELRENLEKRGYEILPQPIPKIELSDNRVDLVHSADLIEHLTSYHDVIDFFLETHRVLKPNGYVSVIAPNYNTLQLLFFAYEYQHTFITNQERIEGLIKDAGFQVERSVSFLTTLGLMPLRFFDRLFVHMILPLARNSLLYTVMRKILGRDLLFRAHKNLCDHVAVIGKKYS